MEGKAKEEEREGKGREGIKQLMDSTLKMLKQKFT